MKLCVKCGSEVRSPKWTCSSCNFTPETIDGFVAFAPGLARASDGYREESIHRLDSLQHRSFWFRARNRLITDIVARYSPAARAILEIGCGSGYVLNALLSSFPRAQLSGSEIYAQGLAYTRDRVGKEVILMQMDARQIPFESEFDVVGAFDVIEHIEQDREVIASMRKSVKPGGFILVTVPQHPFMWSGADDYACHKRRYTRSELANKMRDAGLDVVLDTSFVTLPFPAMVAQRLLRGQNAAYDPTNELELPLWMDRTLEALLDVERTLIMAGASLPFGGSRVVLARRPA